MSHSELFFFLLIIIIDTPYISWLSCSCPLLQHFCPLKGSFPSLLCSWAHRAAQVGLTAQTTNFLH